MQAGALTVTSPPTPLGVAVTRALVALDASAREHKRLAAAHRRAAQKVRSEFDALQRAAAGAGIHTHIEGEAQEASHGPEHHTSTSAPGRST